MEKSIETSVTRYVERVVKDSIIAAKKEEPELIECAGITILEFNGKCEAEEYEPFVVIACRLPSRRVSVRTRYRINQNFVRNTGIRYVYTDNFTRNKKDTYSLIDTPSEAPYLKASVDRDEQYNFVFTLFQYKSSHSGEIVLKNTNYDNGEVPKCIQRFVIPEVLNNTLSPEVVTKFSDTSKELCGDPFGFSKDWNIFQRVYHEIYKCHVPAVRDCKILMDKTVITGVEEPSSKPKHKRFEKPNQKRGMNHGDGKKHHSEMGSKQELRKVPRGNSEHHPRVVQ